MWKPSKRILFIITAVFLTTSGVLYQQVNWDLVLNGEKIVKELHLPTLYLCIGLYHLWMYKSSVKSEK